MAWREEDDGCVVKELRMQNSLKWENEHPMTVNGNF
jgi:hypothetical protein